MNARKLAKALRAHAENLQQRSIALGERELDADSAELARVLARIMEGMDPRRAFGAPGDWGYGTPIGDALAANPEDPFSATATAARKSLLFPADPGSPADLRERDERENGPAGGLPRAISQTQPDADRERLMHRRTTCGQCQPGMECWYRLSARCERPAQYPAHCDRCDPSFSCWNTDVPCRAYTD